METDFLFHFGPFDLYMEKTAEENLYRLRDEGRPVWNSLARREIGDTIEAADKAWLLSKARRSNTDTRTDLVSEEEVEEE
jgi:hypothetical protein